MRLQLNSHAKISSDEQKSNWMSENWFKRATVDSNDQQLILTSNSWFKRATVDSNEQQLIQTSNSLFKWSAIDWNERSNDQQLIETSNNQLRVATLDSNGQQLIQLSNIQFKLNNWFKLNKWFKQQDSNQPKNTASQNYFIEPPFTTWIWLYPSVIQSWLSKIVKKYSDPLMLAFKTTKSWILFHSTAKYKTAKTLQHHNQQSRQQQQLSDSWQANYAIMKYARAN